MFLSASLKMILAFQKHGMSSGHFDKNRNSQQEQWLDEILESKVRGLLGAPNVVNKKKQLVKKILKNDMLPTDGAMELWDQVFKRGPK